jgi:hypothetical protein
MQKAMNRGNLARFTEMVELICLHTLLAKRTVRYFFNFTEVSEIFLRSIRLAAK